MSLNNHLNFNNNYIEALFNYTSNIDFVFKKNYSKKLNIKNDSNVFSIPEKYFSKINNSSLSFRFGQYRILTYIKKKINFRDYDLIFLSSYEEFSTYISLINYKLILVNHNNIRRLDNPFKFIIFKKLTNNNINIVFENYIKIYLENFGLKNINIVSHGLPKPMPEIVDINLETNNLINNLSRFNKIIFSPSSSSSSLEDLASNKIFISYLEKNKIVLILKDNFKNYFSDNIIVINNFLTDPEYNYLFKISNLILIPYSKQFNFRVSGILFECFSNKKMCLVSDISAFRQYQNYFNYEPYFKDVSSLIQRIDKLIVNDNNIINEPYKTNNQFKINFDFLFNL